MIAGILFFLAMPASIAPKFRFGRGTAKGGASGIAGDVELGVV
jgi:hypothetical protein